MSSALSVIVALGTGMIFTRRTAPLAGGGLLTVALVPTLWYGAAVPFAAATLGVVAYRLVTLWAPLPASLAAIPKLRELGRRGEGSEATGTATDKGEPALQHWSARAQAAPAARDRTTYSDPSQPDRPSGDIRPLCRSQLHRAAAAGSSRSSQTVASLPEFHQALRASAGTVCRPLRA